MGGCPMGGYGWGEVQEKELIDAVHTALDKGINFFDTADTYGLGQSEITLAKGLGNQRKNVVVQSKFGVRFSPEGTVYDNTPEYIRSALEKTLLRLNTDYIDIYTIHYRDNKTPLGMVVDTLSELRQEGKIRYFGLSNIDEEQFEEMIPYANEFVCCQDEFSLACRKHEQSLSHIEKRLGISPLTWGSLGQGILTGKYDRNATFNDSDRRSRDIYVNFHGEKFLKNLDIVDAMRPIADKHEVSVAAVAVRFILDYLPESVVLAGAKRPSQILGNIESMGWHLTEDELKILDAISR
jgi:uncharacterized oxidoreductase yccK